MTEYALIAIAFLATLVSLFGDTWKPGRRGLARLTVTGRGVFAVALVALVVSICQTRATANKLRWEETQRERLRVAALHRIRDAVRVAGEPLHDLYVHTVMTYQTPPDVAALQRFEDDRDYRYAELSSAVFRQRAQSIRYSETAAAMGPNSTYQRTWSEYLAATKLRMDAVLNEMFARYGPYLDLETSAVLSAVIDDDFYHYLELFVQQPHLILPVETFELGDSYVEYLAKLHALDVRVNP